MYCAFIDYTKAFDTIERSALWSKLLDEGIQGKIFNVIQSMYQEAKSCVKCNNEISPFFPCDVGVRQGENLSPVLFAIFLNDFQEYLSSSCTGLDDIHTAMSSSSENSDLHTFIKLFTLLYADDTILLAETPDQLQESLNALHEYCNKWHLKVNIDKTKVVIFSKGYIIKHPKFFIGSAEVGVSREYTYLGVVFSGNGHFKSAIKKQITQARKAQFALIAKAKVLQLPIDIILELYDQCITPILLYGCEVWGFSESSSIEVFHRSFLRQLFRVFGFTANCMLYGESGMPDMRTKINIRLINFWAKLKNGNQSKLSATMCKLISKLHDQDHFPDYSNVSIVVHDCEGRPVERRPSDPSHKHDFKFKWVKHIKDTINKVNLFNFWTSDTFDPQNFKTTLKQKCNLDFKLRWEDDLRKNSQCEFYRKIKSSPSQEKYIKIQNYSTTITLARFRMGSHHLPLTHGRFKPDTPEENKFCTLCSLNVVGDEIHYLSTCDFFNSKREKLFPQFTNSNATAETLFRDMFEEGNEDTLTKLASFSRTIMNQFTYEKPIKNSMDQPESLAYKPVQATRCGRNIRPPAKLNL